MGQGEGFVTFIPSIKPKWVWPSAIDQGCWVPGKRRAIRRWARSRIENILSRVPCDLTADALQVGPFSLALEFFRCFNFGSLVLVELGSQQH